MTNCEKTLQQLCEAYTFKIILFNLAKIAGEGKYFRANEEKLKQYRKIELALDKLAQNITV